VRGCGHEQQLLLRLQAVVHHLVQGQRAELDDFAVIRPRLAPILGLSRRAQPIAPSSERPRAFARYAGSVRRTESRVTAWQPPSGVRCTSFFGQPTGSAPPAFDLSLLTKPHGHVCSSTQIRRPGPRRSTPTSRRRILLEDVFGGKNIAVIGNRAQDRRRFISRRCWPRSSASRRASSRSRTRSGTTS